jgi:hypothetical protein
MGSGTASRHRVALASMALGVEHPTKCYEEGEMVGLDTIQGDARDPDARVILYGSSWWQFESMLAIRGDKAGVRLAYLEGSLELTRPSQSHERIKTMLARIIESYAEEAGVTLDGYGSLTMRNPSQERAAEPDECYVVGGGSAEPNLVIEVVWTSGGARQATSLRRPRRRGGLGVARGTAADPRAPRRCVHLRRAQ